ncbi:MAG: preprotein translocase subunit SecG [Gammaproteobacteria bacterium]|jgi:preprotein translocase subunit SecG|nr:preprotein translocase subunit SecG [Gammaproteobacteria bacterium]
MIYTILLVVAVILSILIIFFILMQQGKGDASGMFGGGSSGAVFGASGAGNFITKLTTFLVVLFFLNCLALAYLAKSKVSDDSVIISNDSSLEDVNGESGAAQDNTSQDNISIPD